MKKKIRVEIIAEMEVNTLWYDNRSDAAIKKVERDTIEEWFFDNIIKEKISLRKA